MARARSKRRQLDNVALFHATRVATTLITRHAALEVTVGLTAVHGVYIQYRPDRIS